MAKRNKILAAAAGFSILAACASDGERTEIRSPLTPEITAPEDAAPAPGTAAPVRNAAADSPVTPAERLGRDAGARSTAEGYGEQLSTARFTLNFESGPVTELAQIVVVDILGLNLVVDPAVEGEVTVDAAGQMTDQQMLALLRSALSAHGASLDSIPGGYQVRSSENPAFTGAGFDGEGEVRAIFLRHADATQLRAALGEVAPDSVRVAAFPEDNVLIVSGAPSGASRVAELARSMDNDLLDQYSFALTPLENADATTTAEDLSALFGSSGSFRVRPVTRLNALLIVTADRALLREAQTWAARLDQPGGPNDRRLYTYHPRSAQAVELAASVAPLVNARFASTENGAGGFTAGGAENRLVSPMADIETQTGPAAMLSEDAAASDPADVPRQAGAAGRDAGSAGESRGRGQAPAPVFLPNARTNTLLVMATGDEWETIAAALRTLDRRPAQVVMEATIVEVMLTDELRYGLRFLYEGEDASIGLGSQTGALGVNSEFVFDLATDDIGVTLDALSSLTQLNVVSSPKLMVVNGETAALQIGDEVPVAVQSAVPTEDFGNGRIVNTIEFRDTGVILQITPRVAGDETVSLTLEQEVSDVVETTTSDIDSPTIRQRRVRSVVDVQSGQTIVIAGLARDRRNAGRSGVPGLRDVPVIGSVFGSNSTTSMRSELLVFLKPRIVDSPREAARASQALNARMDALLREMEGAR